MTYGCVGCANGISAAALTIWLCFRVAGIGTSCSEFAGAGQELSIYVTIGAGGVLATMMTILAAGGRHAWLRTVSVLGGILGAVCIVLVSPYVDDRKVVDGEVFSCGGATFRGFLVGLAATLCATGVGALVGIIWRRRMQKATPGIGSRLP
jgi:hypothetical protein